MGIRFALADASLVHYLVDPSAPPPRTDVETLSIFLSSLEYGAGHNVLAADDAWVSQIASLASKAREQTLTHQTLTRQDVVAILQPLARALSVYDLVVLPVADWRNQDEARAFADEVAHAPTTGILVLIPEVLGGRSLKTLDPTDAVADALRRRSEWPGAIFTISGPAGRRYAGSPRRSWNDSSYSRFLPLASAYETVMAIADLFDASHHRVDRSERAREILERAGNDAGELRGGVERRSVLHLSDLHFGTTRAAQTVSYLQANIAQLVGEVDRVAITGDLFDQPRLKDLQQYRNFANSLTLLGAVKPAVIVPGNHEQRIFGTAIKRLGRASRAVSQLDWATLEVDEDMKVVFLCFDSARDGDLARGRISADQLLAMAAQFDARNARGGFEGFLRVALVHHHPFPYGDINETEIVEPGWFSGEALVAMEDADRFISWCSQRQIGLVLHGHKHVPRLVNAWTESGSEIIAVGCGSSTGAGGGPLSFNVVEWDDRSESWSVDFKVDRGDGAGFASAAVQSVSADV